MSLIVAKVSMTYMKPIDEMKHRELIVKASC